MHKRIVNQATIELTISPVGPLLIKASEQGADPTKPDMEFVETYHAGGRTVYLPGSSLKGAIRAHCERIVRTLGGEHPNNDGVWACNPLRDKATDPSDLSCSKRLENQNKALKNEKKPELTGSQCYSSSCTTCQLFGNMATASHARIEDAYPINSEDIRREERNGVAIDRVYGSVAVGPFNFEVLTAGEFTTKITVKNFTTAQLALIALAIRDFDEQRVSIGFAKSRGLGQVNMKVNRVKIHYPTAVVENGQLQILGHVSKMITDNKIVMGAGELVSDDQRQAYGFPESESFESDVPIQADEFGLGATLNFEESEHITKLWKGCVSSWKNMVEGVR